MFGIFKNKKDSKKGDKKNQDNLVEPEVENDLPLEGEGEDSSGRTSDHSDSESLSEEKELENRAENFEESNSPEAVLDIENHPESESLKDHLEGEQEQEPDIKSAESNNIATSEIEERGDLETSEFVEEEKPVESIELATEESYEEESCEVGSVEGEVVEDKSDVEDVNESDVAESLEGSQNSDVKTSKKTWFSKLKFGLGKSSSKLNEGLKNIFSRRKLDDEALEDLEDLLIMSDLGATTSSTVIENLAKNKFDKEITAEEIKSELSGVIEEILQNVAVPLKIESEYKPQVILVCGVNGAGKTTTIGKLSSKWKKEGKSVMIAACDTFRAAAVEQLEVWANRSGCEIVKGKEASDPASVAYSAYQKAKDENYDILVIDTAGRLQNKKNLMEQLSKIVKVIKKIDDSAPHNSLIVLDATTGQNANSQVKIFGDMVDLNGIIVTKLDGTAKGGVVVSLARQFEIPIHAVGVGEGIDDLNTFEAKSFADSLVG